MNEGLSHVHEVLLSAGYKADSSNKDRISEKLKPLIYFKEQPVNGPACESEKNPPRIIVEVYHWLIQSLQTDNAITLSLCGAREYWTQISIYAVKLRTWRRVFQKLKSV
jgi:hypothetical protein